MKIAHLILTHNNPKQLELLISQLTYADDAVYIHLDKKVPVEPFLYLKDLKNVFFISERVKVKWGAYSMVAATINGFGAIINSGINYQFVNLLSGCDYPLQTPQHIHRFLENNKGKAFMSFAPIYTEWQEAVPRIENYHLTNYNFPGRYALQKMLNFFLPKRKMPGGMVPVGRSQWFTASTDCIQYILNYLKQNNSVRRFMKLTWGADEFVFQTLLYNSPYRKQLVNNNLRHIDWSAGGASPTTFTIADSEQLLSSEKLYARKFDLDNHADMINAINQKLNNKVELRSAQV